MSEREKSTGSDGDGERLKMRVKDHSHELSLEASRRITLSELTAFYTAQSASVRILFRGVRVNPSDTPELVSVSTSSEDRLRIPSLDSFPPTG